VVSPNGHHADEHARVSDASQRVPSDSVLVAIAHPDDETLAMGGTLARLARCGRRVSIVCATRGESGWIADPYLATPKTLAAVREQELRSAAQILGVEDVQLLDYRDGTLPCIDPTELTEAFARVMRQRRPAVVVTWGADGGYGHPDHVAVHEAVTRAFLQAVKEANGPRALYYFAVQPPRLSQVLRRLRHRHTPPPGTLSRRRAQGSTTVIDVSAFRTLRQRALRQYRSQVPADIWLLGLTTLLAPRNNFAFSHVERFHRAYPAVQPGEAVERTLWSEPTRALR
jgi:LmbE family N-acetylglucosaminyl deacetylase